MVILIKGRFPTLNDYRNFNHWQHTEFKTTWEHEIAVELRNQKIRSIPHPCVLTVVQRTKKKRDNDNCVVAAKYFQDTIVAMELIPDDNPDFITELRLRWQKADGDECVEYLVDKV